LARESVGLALLAALAVGDVEVETSEKLRPSGLPTSKDLGGVEVLESFVIGEDGDLLAVSLAIISSPSKGFDDGEELLVVEFIVELGREEFARVEGDRAERGSGGGRSLREYRCDGEVGSVGFEGEGESRVEDGQDGSGGEEWFELLERGEGGVGGLEDGSFTEEGSEGSDDGGEARDESSIEVSEAEEGLDVLDRTGLGPVKDRLDLRSVPPDAVGANDEAEEVDLVLEEGASSRFYPEFGVEESIEDEGYVMDVIGSQPPAPEGSLRKVQLTQPRLERSEALGGRGRERIRGFRRRGRRAFIWRDWRGRPARIHGSLSFEPLQLLLRLRVVVIPSLIIECKLRSNGNAVLVKPSALPVSFPPSHHPRSLLVLPVWAPAPAAATNSSSSSR
jgi:hypothetical protein